MVEEERRYFSLHENEIVAVLGQPTDLAQVCPQSEHPIRTTINRGTHRITWEAGCTLETHDFSLSAASMPVGQRKVSGWQIFQDATNIKDYFVNKTYPSILPPLLPLNYDKLPIPPAIQWTNPSYLALWITIICIIILAIGIILWRIKYPARSANRGQKSHSKEEQSENHASHLSLSVIEDSTAADPPAAAVQTYSFRE